MPTAPTTSAYWLEPARSFVEAAGPALRAIAPEVRAEPKVNGSIFRINRDIRFSPDKRPYKDHLDFWFWEGERTSAVSGFYLLITTKVVAIGVGAHSFDRERLAAYRNAVVDPATGLALVEVIAAVERKGYHVDGETYKQLPRGFTAAEPPQERLLRHSALHTGVEEKLALLVHTPELLNHVAAERRRMAPLHRWLADAMQ